MTAHIEAAGLSDAIVCDSAGTTGYHAGEKADRRMRQVGQQRGYAVTSISRKVVFPDDFAAFDYVIGMDDSNMRDLRALDRDDAYGERLFAMTSFCREVDADHVPDPYYGGTDGFDHVLDILEDACAGLLDHVKVELDG